MNQLPHSPEAERAVLGGLLLTPKKLYETAELIQPSDFYFDQNASVFRLILSMASADKPIELVSVIEEISTQGSPEDYGGYTYLASLSDNIPSTENILHYAGIIKEKAKRRQLITAAKGIIDEATHGTQPAEELLSLAEKKVFDVRGDTARLAGVQSLLDAAKKRRIAWKSIVAGDRSECVPTGFEDFDNHYGGWPRGYVSFIGGRPAQGKTLVAVSMMMRAAELGVPQGIISIEMPTGKLVDRMASALTGLSVARIHERDEKTEQAFADAATTLEAYDLYVDDEASSLTAVESSIRRMARQYGCQVIWIDYYQLIRPRARKEENQSVGLDDIGNTLREIAKQEGIAIVSLLQFNQQVDENRVGKRKGIPAPRMSRGSEGVYLHAALYFGIYRQFHYHPPEKPSGGEYDQTRLSQMYQPLELICLKSRERAPRDIGMWVQLETQRLFGSQDEGFNVPDWGDVVKSRAYGRA